MGNVTDDSDISYSSGKQRETIVSRSCVHSCVLLFHSFLHVNFQRSEGLFVALNGRLQGKQHSLCREEIGYDSIGYGNRRRGNANRLRIETEVDDEFFRGSSYTAKVGIRCGDIGVVKLDGQSGIFRGLLFGHVRKEGVKGE